MDIYKQDTGSRKFCIKYEKMNDFTINKDKDENKVFDCSKEQTTCVYSKIYKIIWWQQMKLITLTNKEELDILFDGSNNTDYSKCGLGISPMFRDIDISYLTINYYLNLLQQLLSNQVFEKYKINHKLLYILDGKLDKMMSFLKPNIMDDINDAKLYKKCMIYKDFFKSKLKQQ